MYQVIATTQYEKSLRKLVKAGLKKKVQDEVAMTIQIIASEGALPSQYRDHKLKGEFKDYRECHIQGDLLLVYQIVKGELVLVLLDIGTHADLF